MAKKFNKIGGIIVIVFLIGMVLIGLYKRHLLFRNFEFTVGRITEITVSGWKSSGDYSVLYEYRVDGKNYQSNNNYNYCHHMSIAMLKSLLIGKSFPLVYARGDHSTGILLLTQENADRFNYQLPDSVKYYDSVLTCK